MSAQQNRSKRSLLRFDYAISASTGEKYAGDAQKVVRHAFFPFISYSKVSPRYRKVKGSKGKTELKVRPIRYASHLDSAIYSYYAARLSETYEPILEQEGLQSSVIAYRKLNRSNIDFASEVFAVVRSEGDCCVICLDIESFFDTIDHELLKQAWRNLVGRSRLRDDEYKVFKSVTAYAHVDRDKLSNVLLSSDLEMEGRLCTPEVFRTKIRPLIEVNRTSKGVPQGSSISAVLSNIYMIEFDKAMVSFCRQNKGHYRRYSDDILLVVPPSLMYDTHRFVESQLRGVRLSPNNRKSETCVFSMDASGHQTCDRPLQYLGFTYDGNKVLIRSSTLSRYNRKLRRYVAASVRKARACGDSCLHRRKAYELFTMRGRRNFISYAQRAHGVMCQNHNSGIDGQIRRHWAMVHRLLANANAQLAASTTNSPVHGSEFQS